jgi:hypothetical protein
MALGREIVDIRLPHKKHPNGRARTGADVSFAK